MTSNPKKELQDAQDRILRSSSRKKLVVAGPGTGKTFLFRKLLEHLPGNRKNRLVLTFINNLKLDLERSLSDLASIFTLHGYCQSLLHKYSDLREGLSDDFRCLPGLASIIKADWGYIKGGNAPSFIDSMRKLEIDERTDFYLSRGNYYDAVDFDDSVFRTYKALHQGSGQIESYDLVLIDEYQDFNRMEAAVIDILAEASPILIAGDDDQALYSQLRGSSWDFIRQLHQAGQYEVFQLPFCLRCPQVIVDATNDIVAAARQQRHLQGRINKPFQHCEPVKGEDSKKYPKLSRVVTSVQRPNANYFGRYIQQAIEAIPKEELKEANEKDYPAVLIIGSKPYRPQVVDYLNEQGYYVDTSHDKQTTLSRFSGLQILKEDIRSNLGWRILLETDRPSFAPASIRAAAKYDKPLFTHIPEDYRNKILEEVAAYKPEIVVKKQHTGEKPKVTVKVTSYEGAKGLSAQHVFIIGVHEEELPRHSQNIQDLEICKFIVGLTRTRKKCTLLCTQLAGKKWKRPSPFLGWIKQGRYDLIKVDAGYWKKKDGG